MVVSGTPVILDRFPVENAEVSKVTWNELDLPTPRLRGLLLESLVVVPCGGLPIPEVLLDCNNRRARVTEVAAASLFFAVSFDFSGLNWYV